MGSSLLKKLKTHWARGIKDKRIAIQLIKVNPFIFFACRYPRKTDLMKFLDEPFAIITSSFSKVIDVFVIS